MMEGFEMDDFLTKKCDCFLGNESEMDVQIPNQTIF